MTIPEVRLAAPEADRLTNYVREVGSVDEMERAIMQAQECSVLPPNVRATIAELWRQNDHVVIRGLPHDSEGASFLAVAGQLFAQLKTYRGSRIVKRFRLSPWTDDLSHTLADGNFHTDINTAPVPPRATLMQCLIPDPRAPEFGQLRVVRLRAILSAVSTSGRERLRRFLTEDEVTMVNDRDNGAWSGKIAGEHEIRFHPQTLRDAAKRYGTVVPDLEECLQEVHQLALSLSAPIDLGPGDVLIVSNRRALHQRGACTVRFRAYPRDFDTREVAVAHAMDEIS